MTNTASFIICHISMNQIEIVWKIRQTGSTGRQGTIQIFIDGGYLTILDPKNEPINDVDSFITGFINKKYKIKF